MSKKEDLYWVFKVLCGKCGWNGYSDQCLIRGVGVGTLFCPECESIDMRPIWGGKNNSGGAEE